MIYDMNKLLILPLFFLTMCGTAPVTDPPAHALEVEGGVEQWIYMVEYLKNYQREENMTDPDDAINSALEEFWEVQDGSDGSTEQEELLQL